MTTAANATGDALLRTPLYSLHRALGARMVPFAGFELPLQYATGILQEHLHTRAAAGLFDISHMGQIRVRGAGADVLLETLVPGDIAGLGSYRQRYTVLTNDAGGIIDDLMITRLAPQEFLLVVNGACRAGDLDYVRRALPAQCAVELAENAALLALQGPAAEAVLARLNPAVSGLRFLCAGEFRLAGVHCLVHRCGYTGEDGFELSVPAAAAEGLARCLLADPAVRPVGLGARDTLRLEAGLCLYGHDLDQTTTPVAAALGWTIAPRYRQQPGLARFPGAQIILAELVRGSGRRRVGLLPLDRAPVREGALILDQTGGRVGTVTSGGFGPTVGAPIAMGYVTAAAAAPETVLAVELRQRRHALRVTALPFVAPRYHRM